MEMKIMPVKVVGSNKDVETKDELLTKSLRQSIDEEKSISNFSVIAKKKYYKDASLKIYKSLEKNFYLDKYGLYRLNGQDDSYIYSNALIGVLSELCSDSKNSTRVLNLIHEIKMEGGTYPLSLNKDVKNSVSDVTVAILENLKNNKKESERLLALKGYTKKDGLYTSTNDQLVIQTFMNSMKGVADSMLGNVEKGKKTLQLLSSRIPKTKEGIFYVSNDKKIIMPEAIISIAMLKLFAESFKAAEEYLKNLEISLIDSGNVSVLYGIVAALFSKS
ncbi:MAG: hypothetical protein ACP5M9_03940 [Candidatus Micrarchaeia archaeon]